MNTEFINTRDYYHQIINAPDAETRQQRYLELLVQPWQQMMSMVSGHMPGNHAENDPLAGAKAWNWLLPDDLTEIPAALHTLEQADAWRVGAEAMREAAARFAPYADRVPFDEITGWLVLSDPKKADPIMRGYTGATDWMQPRIIAQFDVPNDYNLPRLPGLIVHEMHHLVRMRVFPWTMQTTVADYIIVEGTAESFAGALYGDDCLGYYVTDFDDSEIETAREVIGAALDKSGFDVIRSYIFGDAIAEKYNLPQFGIPAYGGYAIGYRVVQAFMQRTGKSIEETTFIPAQEIIKGSGFFE